jgi:hypothetical protein
MKAVEGASPDRRDRRSAHINVASDDVTDASGDTDVASVDINARSPERSVASAGSTRATKMTVRGSNDIDRRSLRTERAVAGSIRASVERDVR